MWAKVRRMCGKVSEWGWGGGQGFQFFPNPDGPCATLPLPHTHTLRLFMVIPSLPFHKSGSCQWGLIPGVLVMNCQIWVFFLISLLQTPLSFPLLWAPLSSQCSPGPGLQHLALSSLMNWTPWPQVGDGVETLEV